MLNEIQKFGGLRVAEPGKLFACANQLAARCISDYSISQEFDYLIEVVERLLGALE